MHLRGMQVLAFCCDVDEVRILLGYDVASLGIWFLTF